MKKLFLVSCLLLMLSLPKHVFSQSVGIGTANPNAKAILDIKATDKGILFPRLTSAQRNAITNPPDGLHIYNKDERCLNYYDSVYQVWNCYCQTDTCRTVTITISSDTSDIDFYAGYASKYPGVKKFSILIPEDIYITANSGAGALNFSTMPGSATIRIVNNGGLIYGYGGIGGGGASGQSGSCTQPASNGTAGGHAIVTKPGVIVTIINYGIVAGGGGGGGGGGQSVAGQFGGGGGGGAGIAMGAGGPGGGNTTVICVPIAGCICTSLGSPVAASGTGATNVTPGNGGAGASGGGNGGNGGALGQTGQNGTGTAAGIGGTAGKAISGGSDNTITNIGFGQSFGVVD